MIRRVWRIYVAEIKHLKVSKFGLRFVIESRKDGLRALMQQDPHDIHRDISN